MPGMSGLLRVILIAAESSCLSRYGYQPEVVFLLPHVINLHSFATNRGMNLMKMVLLIRKWLLICHRSNIITVMYKSVYFPAKQVTRYIDK